MQTPIIRSIHRLLSFKNGLSKYNSHKAINYCSVQFVHTSSIQRTFWESDKKYGYKSDEPPPTFLERVKDGFGDLKGEFKLFFEEVREKWESDPVMVFRKRETDVVFTFKTPESLDKWMVGSDSDHGEGRSTASLTLSPSGHGLFSGHVNSELYRDGKVRRTGYASLRSLRARKSFKRDATYDWSQYNMLILRIRGDGRSYLINLHTEGYFDLMWNDIYHYVLYTRGGPHWQLAKIPFSKFFYSSKGRVQDRQEPIKLNRITHFGFSVSAKNEMDGHYNLEIDYIGLEYDPDYQEEFAYEMYRLPKYIAAN